jgi:hypothetical protein
VPYLQGRQAVPRRRAAAAALGSLLTARLRARRRAVFLSGLRERVPTRHSVALCFMFGPLGLLSHGLTRAGARALQRRALRRRAELLLSSLDWD